MPLALPGRAQAAEPDAAAAEELLALANQARAQAGLPTLRKDAPLAGAARAHAEQMAQQPDLSHQYPGEPALEQRASAAGAHFSVIAENIAAGASPGQLHREWMGSPPHRANILDPRLTAAGVAVVASRGWLFAVVDFSRAVEPLGRQQVEQQVAGLLAGYGVAVRTGKEATLDARQSCEMEHGSAGGSQPLFVMRWESSDLTRLPPQLTARLARGDLHSASVGSCTSARPGQAFATYRVAVLLFP
jgi:hypothetical protein